jgi:hypothetical protein
VVFRTRTWLAAALGLWMAHPLVAGEPARLGVAPNSPSATCPTVSVNQQLANTIADHLRQSGHLRHYDINVVVRNGVAEVAGTVTDQPQHEEVLRIVQGVPGVERVRDRVQLALCESVTQAQAVLPSGPELSPVPHRDDNDNGNNNGNDAAPKARRNAGPRGAGVEPTPIFQAPPMPSDMYPPRMPPHAWPTYAPYNNYSRVAYPELYPYNSWPFIGPMYPFPKVPLGWRKIKLEWMDGHWWYSKPASGFDWWRVRYW